MTDSRSAEDGAAVATRRTVNDLLADARARLERLEPTDAHRAMLGHEAILVDTRCAELRRETGRCPGFDPRAVVGPVLAPRPCVGC